RQQMRSAQRRGEVRKLRKLHVLPPAQLQARGSRDGERRRGGRRNGGDAVERVAVPSRRRREMQTARSQGPLLLDVAPFVRGGPVVMVEQPRERSRGEELVGIPGV